MIRRAAWRAVGLTELPAAQRKRSRLHGRAAPFRGRTAPEAEGVVTARGEPGAQVGGRSTRRGACGTRPPAARPRDGRRRLGARRRGRCTRGARRAARALTRGRLPRARAAGAKFSPAAAGDAFAARLARTGAPRGAPTAAPAPAAARAPDIARIAKTPFTPSVCFWAVGVCLGSHLPEGLLTPIVARGQ